MGVIIDIIKASKKTAIARNQPSRPTKMLVEMGLIQGIVMDYGCGRGADVRYLKSLGYKAYGFDPNYCPAYDLLIPDTYDTVLNNYVLNVVTLDIRKEILGNIRKILKPGGRAFISVRDVSEGSLKGTPYEDGVITSKGTFQKLFTPEELVELVSPYFSSVEIISKRQPLLVMCIK